MAEEYLTPEEVAERLKVHLKTVYRWLRTGELKGMQRGRTWRIRESNLRDKVVPDREWYLGRSKKANVEPRCPFATLKRCPRYYQSRALLGECGHMTSLEPEEDKQIRQKWEDSEFWPVTREDEPSVLGPSGEPHQYLRFCPEVSFECFGWFAETLGRFADEQDIHSRHKKLAKEGASANDWRWSWASISPLHYTECPLYSVLHYNKG
jgi:excisionase family DNA binding protein